MRVLVTGGTGFIGHYLVRRLLRRGYTVAYTIHRTNRVLETPSYISINITSSRDTYRAVERFAPDVVIHTAALTDADECECSPQRAYQVNVEGTKNILEACERIDCSIVFVSSSFVFSGEENPYEEDDTCEPVNIYGYTKVLAEDAVNSSDIKSLIVRTDQPYGMPQLWQPSSMVTWLLEQLAEASDSIEVFADWYNNPILIDDLCEYIIDLLDQDSTGIYNVVGSEFISRYRWAMKIADSFGYSTSRIKPTNSAENDLPARRPNADLINRKVVKEAGWKPTCISSGLEMLATSLLP